MDQLSLAPQRRWAVASLIANIVIVWTGSLVRLTKSGLGCSTWPQCQPGSYVWQPEDGLHGIIEFGNRTLTFALVAIALGMFVTAVQAWRAGALGKRTPVMAFCVGLGIIAQAVIGGISVRMELNPWVVGLHMVASMALILMCVVLVHDTFTLAPVRVGTGLHTLTTVVFWLGLLIVALGVLVTGAGPHSGDGAAQRNGLSTEWTSKLHAWAVWAIVALTLLGVVWSWTRPRARRLWLSLLAVIVAQGLIGYIQYFTQLPTGLVFAHMIGTTAFATALGHLAFLSAPVTGPNARPTQGSSASTAAAMNTIAK